MIKVKSRGNETAEQMIRRFKKVCEKEGLTKDIKRVAYYEKPSEKAPPPCTFQAAPEVRRLPSASRCMRCAAESAVVGATFGRGPRATVMIPLARVRPAATKRRALESSPMPTTADHDAVHTEHLTKVYKDFWGRHKVRALDDLNLTIHRGEVFGLLGPNGSGKSTTIKLLLGLIFPTAGTAHRSSGTPAGSTTINEKIGFLPEESYLYRFLNGEETLKFYGRLFKIDRADARTAACPSCSTSSASTPKSRKRKLREYSKGMARRIGLAQALINNPDLILLDEPTTGLDPIGTREMKDLILSLKQQGKTVLLCSHLLADVQDVCDRITILFRGKMKTLGAGARPASGEGHHADPGPRADRRRRSPRCSISSAAWA